LPLRASREAGNKQDDLTANENGYRVGGEIKTFIQWHGLWILVCLLLYFAGIKWWNNGLSRPYNILAIIGSILFLIAVILRIEAEFSN
jgi:hypothetical protein